MEPVAGDGVTQETNERNLWEYRHAGWTLIPSTPTCVEWACFWLDGQFLCSCSSNESTKRLIARCITFCLIEAFVFVGKLCCGPCWIF